MATTTTKLKLAFRKSNGDTMNMSYNYVKPAVTATQVKSLVNTILTNGDIFKNVPAASKSAALVSTTTTEIDLS